MSTDKSYTFQQIIKRYEENAPERAYADNIEQIKHWFNIGLIDLDGVIGLGAFNQFEFMYFTNH